MKKLIIILSVITGVFLVLLIATITFLFFFFKTTVLNEKDAIATLKNVYPEFINYPSTEFPPKSIQTEKGTNGWYVAFITEGSGVPIVYAKCYFINNDKTSYQITYNSDNSLIGTFSPKTCSYSLTTPTPDIVGGDTDEHGCIGSAGYSWCNSKNKCLRIWEEPCDYSTTPTQSTSCNFTSCSGLDIQCGFTDLMMCKTIYQIGDKCRQYASCEIVNSQCVPVTNAKFDSCKACVQKCINSGVDSISQFECESNCE